ncbi:MAG: hypothetical protein A2014_03075 [Spirochaetes bacterium GWF1_49_6]|nr:MAG: hypothetical protein A2014_03075 [Spirochaetes bacterium GWF1_49_6]
MMKEMKHVRQIPGEGHRRWFTDEYFDLYVWYDKEHDNDPVGFQLCYGKIETDHALTWKLKSGFSHDGVDTGENSAAANRSPVLVADGLFPKTATLREFDERSHDIDKHVKKFVHKKLSDY